MKSKLLKTALVTCLAVAGPTHVFADNLAAELIPFPRLHFAIPTTPPGMIPMTVYVPAQQMQAPIPPHTHAQKINVTHCLVSDVAVLTQDAPSCEKAGGTVVKERASFGWCPSNREAPCF